MAKKMAASVALLAAVILSPYFYYQHTAISRNEARAASSGASAPPDAAPATLPTINKPGYGKVWVCPMHPEIMQDHPGKCPICGMDLVQSGNHAGHDHSIQVDTATIQKLGVRLALVKMSSISGEINTYGNVMADGNAVYNIYSKFDGWIRKSYIHEVGQKIGQGQVIYEIYSPELLLQQKEFIQFIDRRNQIMESVGDSRFKEDDYVMNLLQEFARARTRFLFEDIGFDTVQTIEDSKQPVEVVKILAAESGVVAQINAREGSFVTPKATLFTLADVSRVWVDVALYPDQVPLARVGDEVVVRETDRHVEKARLAFISPVAENNMVRARIVLNNAGNHLRPGTFADVTIHVQPHEALVLPRSAVSYTGEGNMAMLSRGEGHFLPVHVETGIESGDNVEIVDGLREGAEVAVNGQFLLDAASSMNAAAERLHSGHHD
ncbi:MAG: efflux RND transporter periplasmic adaptor subunit [Gallionellaceae bacterium]